MPMAKISPNGWNCVICVGCMGCGTCGFTPALVGSISLASSSSLTQW